MENRKDVLLRATYDLLTRLEDSIYVKNASEELVHYDGCDCDGSCLREDIAMELDIEDGTYPIELEVEMYKIKAIIVEDLMETISNYTEDDSYKTDTEFIAFCERIKGKERK